MERKASEGLKARAEADGPTLGRRNVDDEPSRSTECGRSGTSGNTSMGKPKRTTKV
jgi:hypothetical protein